MIVLIKEYFDKKRELRARRSFAAEARENLEAYYVMFQINRHRFFQLAAWERVCSLEWPPEVLSYIERLRSYNDALKEYKDFELWYNGDLNNKNQENGRVLHKKKEAAQERFKGLETVIKNAITAIEGIC